jgi:hypothetical protein
MSFKPTISFRHKSIRRHRHLNQDLFKMGNTKSCFDELIQTNSSILPNEDIFAHAFDIQ